MINIMDYNISSHEIAMDRKLYSSNDSLTANYEDFFIQQTLIVCLLQAVHMLSQIQTLLFWLENHQLNMYIVIIGQKIACISSSIKKYSPFGKH